MTGRVFYVDGVVLKMPKASLAQEELSAISEVAEVPDARAISGLPVDVTLTSPGALAVTIGEEESAAENLRCEGVEQALALPESDLRYFGKHGSTLNRRMGVTLATAETAEAARETALKAVDYIRLVDSSKPTGEPSQQWKKDEE